jgi:hypothetical protein
MTSVLQKLKLGRYADAQLEEEDCKEVESCKARADEGNGAVGSYRMIHVPGLELRV